MIFLSVSLSAIMRKVCLGSEIIPDKCLQNNILFEESVKAISGKRTVSTSACFPNAELNPLRAGNF